MMRTGDRWVSGVLRHRNTDEYPMIHSRIEKKCNTESSWLLSSGRKWNKLERFHRPWPYRMAASFQWDKSSIWHGQFLVIICIESSASVLLVFLISVLFIWWLFGWKNVERGPGQLANQREEQTVNNYHLGVTSLRHCHAEDENHQLIRQVGVMWSMQQPSTWNWSAHAVLRKPLSEWKQLSLLRKNEPSMLDVNLDLLYKSLC